MVAQHIQNNPFERKKILTKELGERNLYTLFEKGTTEITEVLEKLPYRDKDYFLEKYLNKYQYLSHPMTHKQQGVERRLLPLSENLDYFYFLQKLQLKCDLESARHIYQVKADLPFIKEVEKEITKRGLKDLNSIHLYSLINQLFTAPYSRELFDELYKSFAKKRQYLNVTDQELILKYIINFASKQINKGNKEYVKIGFELYKIGLNHNILTKSNKITENTFTNIVWFGCFLKEFEFVEHFIVTYKGFLDISKQSELTALCYSNLNFKSANYTKTIKLLITNSFSNHLYKLRAKTLLIKSYFELYLLDKSYFALLSTQIDNFERNIRREEKISQHKKTGYLNFLKFLRKLLDLKEKKLGYTKFQQSLCKAESVSHKPWLLEKSNLN